uniref:DNA-directed RNA polymerase subunit beta' n=1 Tax=Euglena longa TaxID=3037 RepID=RPOC1_EUGLO|nr:RNA polymerase beta' subunit [Euglena longa]P58131.1 RecName: Full=DNA-directed RNA polymerase subunit beta'; AltName: Full=PEP; AltName: Full=Plastid-encoded RNA polymerase subunit beta'; Short=RNA polymerase subunit beta' [Euglena longa]CAC24618.1 RNA polymerase subunit [Euglena longa]
MRDYVKINIASPKQILKWTERLTPKGKYIGKLKNSKKTLDKKGKCIRGGLFCEQIFGPTKKNTCRCGYYKNYKKSKKEKKHIKLCRICNVEITDPIIRNYRMGYIELNIPIINILYLNINPCYLAIITNLKINYLKQLHSGKAYITIKDKNQKEKKLTGGEAINDILSKIDLEKTLIKLTNNIHQYKEKNITIKNFKNILNKIKLYNYLLQTKIKFSWLLFKYLPVLPPNVRPIINMKNNQQISNDLNTLYASIINVNNKIIKLKESLIPDNYFINEKILLQKKVDQLINNEKYKENKLGKIINNKKLKSITENIKGKEGIIRENMLGKTVNFSGRSVIVVEPTLNLNECGLPKEMAINLFYPFIIKELIKLKLIKRLYKIKKITKILDIILENIIKNHYILLNRAPTLHRLNIQAFQPKLTIGKSIKLHPLVCSAFNADFDGDQMGVHIPLSLKAQAEARNILISINNCNSLKNGDPNILPSQDIILGCYFSNIENCNLLYILNKIQIYTNMEKIKMEYKKENLSIHNFIWLNFKNKQQIDKLKIKRKNLIKKIIFLRTTVGRILFNDIIKNFL